MEFNFEENKELFNENLSTGIKISSGIDDEILRAIAENKQLSGIDLPLVIGDGEITASGPEERIEFKEIRNLSINGDADAGLRIALLDSAEDTVEDLITNDNLVIQLSPLDDNKVYGLFSFEYAVKGDIEGDWPLGSITLTSGLDTSVERRAAVIVTLDKSTQVQEAITTILGALQSPKKVTSASDLAAGSYLVIERESALSASFGAKTGFDFDWSFESQNENFPGTVGLQAKLGANLKVGFNIAGEFAVVLSRPSLNDSDEIVRLQLFKRKQNGWNFAAGISASVQGGLGEFDELSIEDIIKGTIGIHHGQILEDLKKLRELTNPAQLTEKLHGLTDELLQEITGTNAFEDARNVIVDLIDKWDAVGETGGAKILELIEENASVNLAEVKDLFTVLSTANVQDFLEDEFSKTGFRDTTFGQVLEAIVPFDDIFEVVAEADLVEKLQDKAGKVAELLDMEAQIKRLHGTISEKLSLDRIRKAASTGNLDVLGDWLKGKLSSLTEGELADELKAINTFISNIENKASKFLESVKKALQKEYGFSLAYSYQKETENAALIDATLDFGINPSLGVILGEALDGSYDRLLTDTTIEGIRLAKGMITHRIKKQKTLSLSIPGVSRNFTKINESFASGSFIDEKDGRLIMYELEAEDEIKRRKRIIQLALNGNYFGRKKGSDFNDQKESLKLAFSFKLQNHKLKTKQLNEIVEPFILANLPNEFANPSDIGQWIDRLDDQIETVSSNGKRRFGRTLINMQLRAPSTVGEAWFKAPGQKKHKIYKEVSAVMQTTIREFVRIFTYDDEELVVEHFNRERLLASLMYISLPPVKLRVYNMDDLIKKPTAVIKRLSRNVIRLVERLEKDPDDLVRETADDFRNTQAVVSEILDKFRKDSQFRKSVTIIVGNEARKVKRTIEKATMIASIREKAATNPTEAIRDLATFGAELTEVLNKIPVGFISKLDTRFIGLNIFLTIASIFDPNIKLDTTGCLELMVLNEASDFDMKSYLDGAIPSTEDLIVSQKILDLGN